MRRLAVLVLSGILICGCGKHAPQFTPASVRQRFGTTISDKPLSFSKDAKPLKTKTHNESDKVKISSSDWLDLSYELMESNDDRLSLKGRVLAQEFYNLKNSNIEMTGMTNPPGSPYAEAAMAFAKPIMIKQYDEAITHVEGMINDIADNLSISVTTLGAHPSPGKLIEKVIIGLKMFEGQLLDSRDGNGDAIIEKIATSVDEKYVTDLQELQKSAALDPKIPLSENLRGLEKSLKKLAEISDSERARLLFQVRYGLSLATQNENIKSPDDALSFLVDFWLAKSLRSEFPNALKDLFQNLSESQILALATDNNHTIVNQASWTSLSHQTNFNSMPEDQVTALYLHNNGNVANDETWSALKSDQRARLDNLLLTDKKTSDFANIVAINSDNDLRAKRYALVVNWLGLVGRLSFPAELRNRFTTLSEPEIELLGHDASAMLLLKAHIELSAMRYMILSGLNDKKIADVRKLFNDTVTQCTRDRVNAAMTPVAETLPEEIKQALIPLLEKSREHESSLVIESYQDYGRYYLGKDVFNVPNMERGSKSTEGSDNAELKRHGLPLIERSNLNFTYSKGQWIEDSGDDISGAQVLGQSLAVLASRLKSESDKKLVTDFSFEAINKMLAIAGYKDDGGNFSQSLSVSVTGGLENSLFNIRAYDPTVTVFAVPDNAKIVNGFKLSSESRVSPNISLEGQMKLLRGYSEMLRYFKPWLPSTFDNSLGALTIDEDPSVKPFLRSDFFLLSMGLASSIVQNIPQRMLGLITSDNRYVDATNLADISGVDAASAVATDFNRDSISRTVKTKSLGEAIFALSEFYEQIKDIEMSEEPVIVAFLKKTPAEKLRGSIQKLISGFVLFSVSHLMDQDGGFYTSYDLNQMKPDRSPKNLTDQLVLEEALLSAAKTLSSGFMAAKAVDNFYFLNNHFWNPDLGFYQQEEGRYLSSVRLLDVARAFKNVNEMQKLLTRGSIVGPASNVSSEGQMKNLLNFWILRYFSPEMDNLSPIDQVQDFSL